jgi:hypothetical protein
MRLTVLCLVLTAATSFGCSRVSTDHPVPAATAAAGQSAAGAPAAAQPTLPAGGVQIATGRVEETMDASNYTYVRVKTGSGELWAASARFKVVVGDRVSVPLETPMQNFHSQSLNRDFPLIYFVAAITPEGHVPAASGQVAPPMAVGHGQAQMPPAMGGSPHGTRVPPGLTVVPLAPPTGGMSVADVWQKRASLNGKTVTVRGTVVKFNAQILDRNWVHIQDGSGKAADGTNDITLTTAAMVKMGDVVTFTGRVGTDRDFTAGYKYQVIIENATPQK